MSKASNKRKTSNKRISPITQKTSTTQKVSDVANAKKNYLTNWNFWIVVISGLTLIAMVCGMYFTNSADSTKKNWTI